MPIPIKNANYTGEALGYFTGSFAKLPGIAGLTTAIMAQKQALEGVFQDVFNLRLLASHPLAGGPWTILDMLGALVGQPRNGLVDSDYIVAIKLRIAVNRSTVRITEWSAFGAILLAHAGGPIDYYSSGNASFFFGVRDLLLTPAIVASVLAAAVPNGVRAVFTYSTWTTGNDFVWADASGAHGQGGWGKADATSGGLWLAALEMS